MTAPYIVDPAGLLGEALSEASPDLMRDLLQTVINSLLSADADAVVGAEWGKPATTRTVQRICSRGRELDTPVAPWTLPSRSCAPGCTSLSRCCSAARERSSR